MNKLLFGLKRTWYKGKSGISGIRDFEFPCFDYEPGQLTIDTTTGCQTDGHYLCSTCKLAELAWNCPDDCKWGWHPSGEWDNPIDGGCLYEEKFPSNSTLEPNNTHRMCPYYAAKSDEELIVDEKRITGYRSKLGAINWVLCDDG